MQKDLRNRIIHQKRVVVRECEVKWLIEAWLVNLAKLYQLQPDDEIVLLPFANRHSVFQMFDLDLLNDDTTEQSCSPSYFKFVWRDSTLTCHIRLRKHLRFTKCSVCVDLRERKTATMDPKKLEQIKKEEYAHYKVRVLLPMSVQFHGHFMHVLLV